MGEGEAIKCSVLRCVKSRYRRVQMYRHRTYCLHQPVLRDVRAGKILNTKNYFREMTFILLVYEKKKKKKRI